MVSVRAILAAKTDPDASLETDPQHIGYLRRSLESVEIYVPFNLASVFPGQERLEPLVKLARAIVLKREHPICISGSATFLGVSIPICDLDFCEYYLSELNVLPDLVGALTAATAKRALTRVKWPEASFDPPFAGVVSALSARCAARMEYIKLDYAWCVDSLGLLPTTSMILKVEEDLSGPASARSFPHQEAVVCEPSIRPRGIIVPSDIGRYLDFLREQAREYAGKGEAGDTAAALKALKRALSFLLMIGADQHEELSVELERVVGILTSPTVEGVVMQRRVEELDEMRGRLPPAAGELLDPQISAIRSSISGILLSDQDLASVRAVANETTSALVTLIDDLYSAAGC